MLFKESILLYFLLMLNMDEFVQLMHHKMLSKIKMKNLNTKEMFLLFTFP